jgi:hypothetical protein
LGYNTNIHGNVKRKPVYIPILNEQKCLLFYFFYKNGEQECRMGLVWGVGASGRGEDVG